MDECLDLIQRGVCVCVTFSYKPQASRGSIGPEERPWEDSEDDEVCDNRRLLCPAPLGHLPSGTLPLYS